jgi:putative ABC transport system substrate-binding protein
MNRRRSLSGLLALGMAARSPGVFGQAVAATAKRVGFLSLNPAVENLLRRLPPLLTKTGWVESRNVSYEWRHAAGNPKLVPDLAAALLALRPDVVVADTNAAALALMRLTQTTPIVVFFSLEPTSVGLAHTLVRPGKNVTGLVWGEPQLAAKIVEFLHQSAPRTRRMAVLYDPGNPGIRPYIDADVAAANTLGMDCLEYRLRNPEDLTATLESVRKDQIQAIKAALGGHFSTAVLTQVLEYSLRYRVPTVSVAQFTVQLGALLAYYPNDSDRLNRISAQLDKLLRGTQPSEIPFEYPSRFDLAVNLRTAKALGITIPRSVLVSADSVIE